MVPGAFFTPCEAMRFCGREAVWQSGPNFYIREIRGETERRERVTPAFALFCEGVARGMKKIPLN